MAKKLRLPDIGEGVAEGEIVKWLVAEGDQVKEDQPLVEVMTDKVNVEIPSPASGTVLKILAREGSVIKVGESILVFGEKGEAIEEEAAVSVEPARPGAPPSPPIQARPEAILATPVVRRIARELGVDISQVRGTGPGGRITEVDVKNSAHSGTMAPTQIVLENAERIPLRGARRMIAERMVQSKRSAAHVTHVDEVDMTSLVSLRENLKQVAEAKGIKLTYLPFVIKALVKALKDHPYVNASIDEQRGEIILKKYYNVGIATSTEGGLVVPVVKEADKKGMLELASEIQGLAEKARQGKLELHDVHDGTFTITNIGPIGGVLATPIINFPEVAILGLNKITKRPVVRDGQIVIRDIMYLSLSFDHRIVDGAEAAAFMNKLIMYLENPPLLELKI